MTLTEYRESKGLTQAECAAALGLRSKGHICDIEKATPGRAPSLALALKIEAWTGGKVTAASICPLAAELGVKRSRVRKAA